MQLMCPGFVSNSYHARHSLYLKKTGNFTGCRSFKVWRTEHCAFSLSRPEADIAFSLLRLELRVIAKCTPVL